MRDFRKLVIWQEGISLVKVIYQEAEKFPSSEKFGLTSQMGRAAISIPSNIAEGCSRVSDKDFGRFLQMALGSAFELETQLVVAKELGFLSEAAFGEINERLNKLQRGINALINKLKRKNNWT